MTLLILLWIIWCVLHSLLISAPINRWVRRRGGPLAAGYRIFYILFSTITLIPVVFYQYRLPSRLLFTWHGWWRLPQAMLLLYAAVLFWEGKKVYDTSYFLGIRQWRAYRLGQPESTLPFRCGGILRFVRHPWYSCGLALLWGLGPLTDVTLTVKLLLSVYLVVGTMLEERKLEDELGEAYRLYRRQVPMLVPWKGRVNLPADLCGDREA